MTAKKTGTLGLSDLLALNNTTILQYGMDPIIEVVRNDLEVHNGIATSMTADLADVTADSMRATGESDVLEMVEVNEFGRSPTQKAAGGSNLGIPMRLFQIALGWTRKFFEQKTPADMARQILAAERAHKLRIVRQIKRAIYLSTNFTVRDFLVTNITLPVKRFLNADSMAIPDGPNGETFNAATHTHYLFNNGLDATSAKALITTVVEHGNGGQVRVVINQADEAAWKALAGFMAYVDPRIALSVNASRVESPRLDVTRLNNRAIGLFEGAEVWVKPWAIANYSFCYDNAGPKPLALRTRNGQNTNLRPAAEIDMFPLHAQYMEDEFDVAVVNRTNGAVLYHAAGAVAYVDPTIT